MVITPDNETLIVSESFTGTLLAFDIADDGTLGEPARLGRGPRSRRHLPGRRRRDLDVDARQRSACASREGGEILDRIQLDRACFATMLGGPDGRTLFMMANEFMGPDNSTRCSRSEPAKVLIADAPAPTAGWP